MNGPYLEIQTSQGMSQTPVGAKPLTIGRHTDNDVVLADPKASRYHAVIERAGSRLRVRDLKSSNGTFLNKRRITQESLSSGDVIQIGSTRIVFLDPSAEPAPLVEAIEELSEADIVEVEEEHISAPAVVAPERPVDAPDADPDLVLQELAESMGQKQFSEYDIALVSARGSTVHEASPAKKGRDRREAVDLFRTLLLICFRSRATDIHLEPKNNYWLLRMRVDGNMVDMVRLTPELGVRMSALVKVLSDIDISQRNVIQEGHFSARVPADRPGGSLRRVDYRVSYAPSVYGQKLVIRILDTSNAPLKIDDLQLPEWMLKELRTAIEADSGMVLVVGPTGSGKTTSLYASVRSIDVSERNVVTIEDPVGSRLRGSRRSQSMKRGARDSVRCCDRCCGRIRMRSWLVRFAIRRPPALPCRLPSPATWSSARCIPRIPSVLSSGCWTWGWNPTWLHRHCMWCSHSDWCASSVRIVAGWFSRPNSRSRRWASGQKG